MDVAQLADLPVELNVTYRCDYANDPYTRRETTGPEGRYGIRECPIHRFSWGHIVEVEMIPVWWAYAEW